MLLLHASSGYKYGSPCTYERHQNSQNCDAKYLLFSNKHKKCNVFLGPERTAIAVVVRVTAQDLQDLGSSMKQAA